MSKKVAAVIVGTAGAVLACVTGYVAYLNKRDDFDLEHLHDDDDDYEDGEEFFGEGTDGDLFCKEEDEDACDDMNLFSKCPCMGKEDVPPMPAGFGFNPNQGSKADKVFAGATLDKVKNLDMSVLPMGKESGELWQKFLEARSKDALNYINTGKVE